MPDESTPIIAAAPEAVVLLDLTKVLAAVAEPTRLAVLREIAVRGPLSVIDLAARLERPADLMSKHLRVLREARIVRLVTPPGVDGRKQFHEIPSLFRARDAAGKPVLDFGAIMLRLE